MSFAIGSGYHLYMMEQEGLLETRAGKINAIIRDFKTLQQQGYDISNAELQEKVLSKYNLNHQLTDAEAARIEKILNK